MVAVKTKPTTPHANNISIIWAQRSSREETQPTHTPVAHVSAELCGLQDPIPYSLSVDNDACYLLGAQSLVIATAPDLRVVYLC